MEIWDMGGKAVMGFLQEDIFEVFAPVRDYDFLGGCVVDTFRRLGEALTRRHNIPREVLLGV
jgi:hypothetical protein